MIAEDIKEQAGVGRRTSAWYANALENALANLQEEDSDTIDTGGITLGSLFFFSYSVAYPEKYPFWDIQPLAVALRFDGDGFLGCNLHYINPDYRDAVAENNIIEVQAYPESNDVVGLKDLFVSFNVSNSTINMKEDVIASGEDVSGVVFTRDYFTSSYSNGVLERK